jgi:hypothetical protein
MDQATTTTTTTTPSSKINNLLFNPVVILILFLIIVFYFIFRKSLGNNNQFVLENNENQHSIFVNIVIGLLGIVVLFFFLQYILNINITTSIKNYLSDSPIIDVSIDHTTTDNASTDNTLSGTNNMGNPKQVFNIPGNFYNYTNAKALCKAYNSDLATYDQVENTYTNGGEWCNYGWSDGQMALFPTQKTTFDNLQKIEGHEHDCGRTGINGGYIANPQIKFGVNCYGIKPEITQNENDLMKTMKPYPETTKDIMFQQQVDYWKNKINEILVSPFNSKSWTQM